MYFWKGPYTPLIEHAPMLVDQQTVICEVVTQPYRQHSNIVAGLVSVGDLLILGVWSQVSHKGGSRT